MVTHRTFNPNDEGSNPSGPTSRPSRGSRDLVDQARLISELRWVQFSRLPLVLLIGCSTSQYYQSTETISAHGVVGTHLLVMQKMRVRFSLGALREEKGKQEREGKTEI